MAHLHLSLLDHGVESAAEALRLLRAEQGRGTEKRSAFRMAGALHQAHLALEKLLKHALAQVDPVLLLKDPNPTLLRELHREAIQRKLPSILASRRSLTSLSAEQAWGAVKEVLDPALDGDTKGAFESALKALTALRNQAQHGEVYADDVEVLSALTRVLSKTPALATAIAPEFLTVLESRHPRQFAEIRAIEQAVNAAWWAIQERLAKRRKIAIPIVVYITVRPGVPTIELTIANPDRPSSLLMAALSQSNRPSLSLTAEVEPDAVSGLFSRAISAEQAKERETARRSVIRQRLASATKASVDPSFPPSAPPEAPLLRSLGTRLGLLGFDGSTSVPGSALHDAILAASTKAFEREREHVEKNGLPPLENGTLHLPSAAAWVQIPFRGDHNISGDVVLQSVAIGMSSTRPRGTISGSVLPPTLDRDRPVLPLRLQGKLWLTNELVVTELSTSSTNPLPVGTIIRYFRGEIRLLLDASPA